MSKNNLISFINEQMDGDFSKALQVLKSNLSKKSGRPKNNPFLAVMWYTYIWNQLEMFKAKGQHSTSFVTELKKLQPVIEHYNETFGTKIRPNRTGYYAWMKDVKPEIYDEVLEDKCGQIAFAIWTFEQEK